MQDLNEKFINYLVSMGWVYVPRREGARDAENVEVGSIDGVNIPSAYMEFLLEFESLSSRDESTWFLSIEDFAGVSDSAFSWDEFEKISLDAATGGEEEESVRAFWKEYLPVAMAVGGDYQFIALSRHTGAVVHGAEPEFESVSILAESFDALMQGVVEGRRVNFFS